MRIESHPILGELGEARRVTIIVDGKEIPARELIDVPVNEMLIVELYSK